MTDDGKAKDWMPSEPTLLDLVRELRQACRLFDGAMPITPEQAWQEAIRHVRALIAERRPMTDARIAELALNELGRLTRQWWHRPPTPDERALVAAIIAALESAEQKGRD